MAIFGHVVVGTCFVLGTMLWLFCLVSMIRTIARRKPDVRLWGNPFNMLFRPADLTEGGLRARQHCLASALGFVLCWLVAVLVGGATGVLV